MSIKIEEIYFVFGPRQSYFFRGPKCSKHRGVPRNWERLEKKDTVRNATMSENGASFSVVEDRKGQRFWSLTGDPGRISGGLEDWLRSLCDPTDGRLAFGPGNRFLAWSALDDYILYTIPDREEASRSAAGFGRLSLATFGVDWAYFYLRPDGRWQCNLKEYYTTLGIYLGGLQPGDIEFIALNPYYVEEFFLLLKNNTAIFRVPLSHRADLLGALEKHGISCTDLVSQRATTGIVLPAKLRKKSFWKEFGSAVAVNSMGATVGAIAQSLIGSASCVMM